MSSPSIACCYPSQGRQGSHGNDGDDLLPLLHRTFPPLAPLSSPPPPPTPPPAPPPRRRFSPPMTSPSCACYNASPTPPPSSTAALMGAGQIDPTVWLLADSFAESMLVPKRYVRFLAFLVRQYLLEKQALFPFAATLVGVYRGEGKEEVKELAGTGEISFDGRGANSSPPTPVPPRDSPYICNMAVKQELNR